MLLNNSHWRESSGSIHFYTSTNICSKDLLQSHAANMWMTLHYSWNTFESISLEKTCHYRAAGIVKYLLKFGSSLWIATYNIKMHETIVENFWIVVIFEKYFFQTSVTLPPKLKFILNVYMHILSSKCTHLLSFKVHNLNLYMWLFTNTNILACQMTYPQNF